MAALLTPGQATVAPLQQIEGERRTVATVVVRGDELQVVTNGLSVNDADETTYVVWGLGEGPAVPLGTFDVSRSQMDMRTVGSPATDLDGFSAVRHQPRTRSGGPAGTDAGRRDRGGDQLSGPETTASTARRSRRAPRRRALGGRAARTGARGTRRTTCTACGNGWPGRDGDGASRRVAPSTTATGSVSASSAA